MWRTNDNTAFKNSGLGKSLELYSSDISSENIADETIFQRWRVNRVTLLHDR